MSEKELANINLTQKEKTHHVFTIGGGTHRKREKTQKTKSRMPERTKNTRSMSRPLEGGSLSSAWR